MIVQCVQDPLISLSHIPVAWRGQAGDVQLSEHHAYMRGTRITGKFTVMRKTIRKRLSARLKELKEEVRRRWHEPVAEVGQWLSVVQGYFNYHTIPGNTDSPNTFRFQVIWHWHPALGRRNHKRRVIWARFWSLVIRWLPRVSDPTSLSRHALQR